MMLLLIASAVAVTWIGICVVVMGVCASAARGDRAPEVRSVRRECGGRRRRHAVRGLVARRWFAHR